MTEFIFNDERRAAQADKDDDARRRWDEEMRVSPPVEVPAIVRRAMEPTGPSPWFEEQLRLRKEWADKQPRGEA